MQTSLNSKLVLPRVNQKVKYLPSGGDAWEEAIILSRAGKATGKYRNFLNIKVTDEEQPKCIDWQHDVTDWEELCEQNAEVLVLFERFDDEAVTAAQKQELDNWKSNDVYQEVPDHGQHALSVRWVITEKILHDEKSIKARLVARGYEEQEINLRTDSPTCSKEGLRIVLSIIASNNWKCRSIDIKAAFFAREPD